MLLYQIALTMIPGIGDVLGKKLVKRCGSAEAVFRESRRSLQKIRGVGEVLSQAVHRSSVLQQAEKEVEFIRRYGITPLFFDDAGYPTRLAHCLDSPLLLFYKGNADLNAEKTLGIVGTRSATAYGKAMCKELLAGLVNHKPLVVSGLAYGIDACAHRAALELGLKTVGVLGHGLDRIYPYVHSELAEKMVSCGGLLTEFPSGTNPDRENFPQRNRIIAGVCDAVVVAEAGTRGGALITADIANSYNRDVFAVPGRNTDPWSEGANYLIRTNQAHLLQSHHNIEYIMGWLPEPKPPVAQRKLFLDLTADEEKIMALLQEKTETGIDEILLATGLTAGRTAVALLNLEFEGVIEARTGKTYSLRTPHSP